MTDLRLPPDTRGPPYHWIVLAIIAAMGIVGILVATRPSEQYPEIRNEFASPVPTFPAELIAAAVAQMTSIAPTPTETPEPPTPARPNVNTTSMVKLICGEGVAIGQTCTMPDAPDPTPTPLPNCPTHPDLDCIWVGTLAGSTPVDSYFWDDEWKPGKPQ